MPFIITFSILFHQNQEKSLAGEREREYYNIVKRIEKAAGLAIRVKILPLDILESYVYPDGAIVVTEGLLKVIHNDDEFAFILAHEVSHLKKPELSDEMSLSFFLEAAAYPDWLKIEMKADIFAVQLMSLAGYAPEAAITVFSRMNPKDIPSYSDRISALFKYLNDASFSQRPGIWEKNQAWEDQTGGFGE